MSEKAANRRLPGLAAAAISRRILSLGPPAPGADTIARRSRQSTGDNQRKSRSPLGVSLGHPDADADLWNRPFMTFA